MTLVKRSDKGEALTYNELDGNFTHLGGDGSYQFPATDGLENQVLTTDGNGQLSFTTIDIDLDRIDGDLTGSVFADDSTLLIDGVAGLIVGPIQSDNIRGNFVGTVSADDSTILVDGNEGKVVGPVETSQLRTSETVIRLGYLAGASANELQDSVYIGDRAGINSSNLGNIAIGNSAAEDNQGRSAIAIGSQASGIDQGDYSIAIGDKAGFSSITPQADRTIVLNATGSALLAPTADQFYVKPVREVTGGTPPAGFSPMYYNPTTGEVIVVSP